jgi:hypothetical protein
MVALLLPTSGKKRTHAESAGTGPEDSKRSRKRWSKDEDAKLREGVRVMGPKSWKAISETYLGGWRSDVQCLHRWSKVLKPGLVKGLWTNEEDSIILQCIDNGMIKWTEIADCVPGRSSKQCRERWSNHLDPSLKKGNWDDEEDKLLAVAQSVLGNCWSRIAKAIPGRSENAIKNRWNSAVHKKAQAGFLARTENKEDLKGVIMSRIETTSGGGGDVPIRRGYVNAQRTGKENLLEVHSARLQNDRKEKEKKEEKKEKKSKPAPKRRKTQSAVSKDSFSGREMQLVQEAFAVGSKLLPQVTNAQQFPQLQLNVNVLQLSMPEGLGDLSKGDLNIGNLGTEADFMGFGGEGRIGVVEDDDGNETDDNSDEGSSMPPFGTPGPAVVGIGAELFMDTDLLALGDVDLAAGLMFEGVNLGEVPRIKPEAVAA